ncbi:SIMPL domain-containing protein, partial [Ligilactobacillus salivarius]|uniref:SIMPL domain-containing protein n=1 Tax=Ligilactobacillus salivarius TaxID=1624 RepID=UPI003C01D19C
GLNLSPLQDYSREGQPPVITGYQAQNIVTARIRDLPRLGTILDTMVGAGATDVQGITFSREDAAATEDRARTEAVTEARRRAEVIARAAG